MQPTIEPDWAVGNRVVPSTDGPHPAVVIGAEAYGPNSFSRSIQTRLLELGYASIVPDYYHGAGPSRPDDYEDFAEVMQSIDGLDFTRGARDLSEAIDLMRTDPAIDPKRVFVWGYCTGGTLAWLAACNRGDIAGAVLFFPSQPVFDILTRKTPVHPMDLLWQLTCPTLVLYGDEDIVMPPERMTELRRRIVDWKLGVEVAEYAGAGHSFTCPTGPMRNDDADLAAWSDAIGFISRHTSTAGA